VYEELDYSLMPEYQEVPSHTGGSGMVPGAWGCPHPVMSPTPFLLHRLPIPGLREKTVQSQWGWRRGQ